jgi:hypothetical protein
MLDSPRTSRLVAAAALLAAPVLFLASSAFEPAWADDGSEYLAQVSGAESRHLAWAALFALGAVSLLAGLLGVARLLRGPRGALGRVGALALGGSTAVMAGIVLAIAVQEVAMVDAAADRAEMVALYERSEDVTLGLVVFAVLWFGGLALGTLALALGLLLRRVVPLWSPLLLVAFLVVMVVAESRLGTMAAMVLLLGGLAPLAHRLATLADDEWARWQPLGDAPPARRAREREVGTGASA